MKDFAKILAMAGLALAGLLSGCGGASLPAPVGMVKMTEVPDSESLTKKFFPTTTGRFYASEAAGTDAPVFGVLQDAKDPGSFFLAGAGNERSWSENVPLEAAGMKVLSVTVQDLFIGDIRKDGTAELMLVVTVESEDDKGQVKQTRRSAYVYELVKGLRLVWYQTLALTGERTTPCQAGTIGYKSTPAFIMNEEGQLQSINVTFEDVGKTCAGGSGCKEGAQACNKRRDEGTVELQWDDELKGFATKGAEEIVLKVPDITL